MQFCCQDNTMAEMLVEILLLKQHEIKAEVQFRNIGQHHINVSLCFYIQYKDYLTKPTSLGQLQMLSSYM